jgi:hypothetical protein
MNAPDHDPIMATLNSGVALLVFAAICVALGLSYDFIASKYMNRSRY